MGCGASLLCCLQEEPSFPLLELPNEIILIILGHMSPSDRLRARVNRKLYLLEACGRFIANEMTICSSELYIDSIKKLASNVRVNSLKVILSGDHSWEILSEDYLSIASNHLSILRNGEPLRTVSILMNSSSSIDHLVGDRKSLRLDARLITTTAPDLRDIFNDMQSGGRPLQFLILHYLDLSMFEELRSLLGIHLVVTDIDVEWHCLRTDVEMFAGALITMSGATYYYYFFIIGTNMKIYMATKTGDNDCLVYMERVDEEGSVPEEYWKYVTRASIREIRNCERRIVKIPVIYH